MNQRLLYFTAVLIAAFSAPSLVFGQSWNVWSTTPVFDGGRVMPLSSFAQQVVKDVCGSTRPFLVPDDSVLAELNRVVEAMPKRKVVEEETSFTLPQRPDGILDALDAGLGAVTDDLRRFREDTVLKIKNMDRTRAERIVQRINQLVPPRGRSFEATELLFSWFAEPEIWDYIPIIAVPESDFRSDVLGVPLENNARTTLRHVSVFQLNHSTTFQRRLVDLEHKRARVDGKKDITRYDRIAERVFRSRSVFQDLVFDPQRHRPDRMIELLRRAGSLSENDASSFAVGQEAWGYLLQRGDDPARRTAVLTEDAESTAHPTSLRWESISRKIAQLAGAFDRLDAHGEYLAPNPGAVERQFELLLRFIDQNLDESAALMERVYPGTAFRKSPDDPVSAPVDVESLLPRLFSDENMGRSKEATMNMVLVYHYSLKTLKREVEAAYIALYDNGRTLRVLPIAAAQALGNVDPSFDVSPWASMRMVLCGREAVLRRFLDPAFPDDPSRQRIPTAAGPARTATDGDEAGAATVIPGIFTSALNERATSPDTVAENAETAEPTPTPTPTNAETAETAETSDSENETADGDEPVDERFEIELFEKEYELAGVSTAATRPAASDSIRWVRFYFNRLASAYAAVGRENSGSLFNESAGHLQQSLREAAGRSETKLFSLIDRDDPAIAAFSAKTVYPAPGAVNSEYRYFRLAPFFWMWFFAAAAIVFVVLSLLIDIFRREMIDTVALPTVSRREGYESMSDDGPLSSRRLDYTNSTEEFLLWGGIAMLGCSIVVTVLGGAMRARISGWAPVTNMYETVVLMAFSAAVLGLWYSLAPLVRPAMRSAFRYTSFPDLSYVLSRVRPRTVEREARSTDGQYAMRQAAQDFGVPGALVDSYAAPVEELRQRDERLFFRQCALALPRIVLMILTFFIVVRVSYGEYAHEHGVFAAALEMLSMHDPIDWLVVIACIGCIVWFVPHLILTLLLYCWFQFRPQRLAKELGIVSYAEPAADPMTHAPSRRRSEMSSVFHGEGALAQDGGIDNSASVWLNLARNQVLDRKLFVLVAAAVTLAAGLFAQLNSTEFNPNIRPLVAVLRSNFWLTVHVIAIIVSYAAAMVAWGMAAVSLGVALFGHYRRTTSPEGRTSVRLPELCDFFSPVILKLVRMALLLLLIGTLLGARWADYSWGRFWSWDPKEVWALITILFFAVVLHGRLARYYGPIGVTVGALFASIAVIFTWYGINFMFKGSMHSYGGDAVSNATVFMGVFVGLNLLWGFLALCRYGVEVHGNEAG